MMPKTIQAIKKAPVSFPDHLLSERLLRFSEYPVEKDYCTDIDSKISKNIYKYRYWRSPLYYNLKHSPEELKDFMGSGTCRHLIAELEICLNYLRLSVKEMGIPIDDTPTALNDGFAELEKFFLSDKFSDHRMYIYSEGKKNLEIITVLLGEKSIDLEFRKEATAILLDNIRLFLCSGACLLHLYEIVEMLKNYNNFSITSFIKAFVNNMAREVALNGTEFNTAAYSDIICALVNSSVENNETHTVHYLCGRLKSDLNLTILTVPKDPFVDGFFYKSSKGKEFSPIFDVIYEKYYDEFRRQFNATNLIRFISNQLYDTCLAQVGNYASLQTFIENQLIKLGKDPGFSWDEILTEEGNLKRADDFMLTISERLLNSGWLNKHYFINIKLRTLPDKPGSSYRIYFNNIALSWIKVEGKRKTIFDILKTKEGLMWLDDEFLSITPNLKTLLQGQNLQELTLFFQSIPSSAPLIVLEILNRLDFNMSLVSLDKLDSFVKNEHFLGYNMPISYKVAEDSINFIHFFNLLSCFSREELELFASHYPESIRATLNSILNDVDWISSEEVIDRLNLFIRVIVGLGFRDFTGIHFKKRSALFPEKSLNYLHNINFEGVTFVDVIFDESIETCSFKDTNLQRVKFNNGCILDSNFNHANLLNCEFNEVVLFCVEFLEANLQDTHFKKTGFIKVDFLDSSLSDVSFTQTDLVRVSFEKAKLSSVIFAQTELFNSIFIQACLKQVNFQNVGLFGADFAEANLCEVDFSTSALFGSSFGNAEMMKESSDKVFLYRSKNHVALFFQSDNYSGAKYFIRKFLEIKLSKLKSFLEEDSDEEISEFEQSERELLESKLAKDKALLLAGFKRRASYPGYFLSINQSCGEETTGRIKRNILHRKTHPLLADRIDKGVAIAARM
jgi:fluoroquinolone resistance protein